MLWLISCQTHSSRKSIKIMLKCVTLSEMFEMTTVEMYFKIVVLMNVVLNFIQIILNFDIELHSELDCANRNRRDQVL